MGVPAVAESLRSIMVWNAAMFEFTDGGPDGWCLEWIQIANSDGESISRQMTPPQLVHMPVRPDHVDAIVLDRPRGLGRITTLPRQVDRDRLTRHRDAVLHAGGTDGLLGHGEVPLQDLDELGMGQTGLLDAKVQVFALATRLVER